MTVVSRRTVLGSTGAAGLAALAPGAMARAAAVGKPDTGPREVTALGDWRFHLGHASDPAKDFSFGASHDTYGKSGDVGTPVANADFDASGWQAVRLPHDWAVDLPFEQFGPAGSDADKTGAYQGFKPLGRLWPATSVGWYRCEIPIAAGDAGRRIALEFDGVSRNCIVILNGFIVGTNESAYAPFRLDVTDFARPGETNVLVIRCDVSLGEAWSYEGAGLYRAVRLVKTAPAHVRQWGARVRSDIQGTAARLTLDTEIDNQGEARTIRLRSRALAPDGTVAAKVLSEPVELAAWSSRTVSQTAAIAEAKLWDLDTPHLYTLVSDILDGDALLDRDTCRFGLRTIHFDADKGFFLNGRSVKIKGTCNHQDHAGVGFAVPDSLHRWRLEKLREMGANAYRSTHHSPSPVILDACDEMGILVMDETRQMSSNAEGMSQLERVIRQGRNHPCVFIWSIGNEEIHRGTATGLRIATTMKRRVYELDGTRPVTEAFNGKFGEGASPVLDVMGCNYFLDAIDPYHATHPDKPMIGTETGSTVMARGVYARDDKAGLVPAYDSEYPRWATTAEHWWTFYNARPFLAGGFVWTGFDYRGEPTPYERWPENSSNFGQMDLCGFPKDNYWYYRAWWSGKPVLHLFPHWNWSGREGQNVAVWVHANCEEVELLCNGRSLGRKRVEHGRHLEWQVAYVPGHIEARGFSGGRQVMVQRRETTGAPARVALTCDRKALAAGDVGLVRAAILDAKGREVPDASNRVHFTLEGDLALLGVGNGDPRCLEPDHADMRSAFNGLCAAVVQAGPGSGPLRIRATAEGLTGGALAFVRD
ncbi:beta-galactosidase GalA [Novosphingobium sp. 9]|uniref:beta-galactosidase GalA n=1 Tax=Novosphingobium sp. 9 TaxID=2025349 RepID=UPI0021B4F030|nr:beta-galactosidase GalA [Novosphingobium sp. 9]